MSSTILQKQALTQNQNQISLVRAMAVWSSRFGYCQKPKREDELCPAMRRRLSGSCRDLSPKPKACCTQPTQVFQALVKAWWAALLPSSCALPPTKPAHRLWRAQEVQGLGLFVLLYKQVRKVKKTTATKKPITVSELNNSSRYGFVFIQL